MRKLLFGILVLVFLVIGCKERPAKGEKSSLPAENSDVGVLVTKYLEAVRIRDFNRIFDLEEVYKRGKDYIRTANPELLWPEKTIEYKLQEYKEYYGKLRSKSNPSYWDYCWRALKRIENTGDLEVAGIKKIEFLKKEIEKNRKGSVSDSIFLDGETISQKEYKERCEKELKELTAQLADKIEKDVQIKILEVKEDVAQSFGNVIVWGIGSRSGQGSPISWVIPDDQYPTEYKMRAVFVELEYPNIDNAPIDEIWIAGKGFEKRKIKSLIYTFFIPVGASTIHWISKDPLKITYFESSPK